MPAGLPKGAARRDAGRRRGRDHLYHGGWSSETAPDLSEEAHDAIWAALQEIRDEMEKKEDTLWRRCTVTLVAGGGFEMEVER